MLTHTFVQLHLFNATNTYIADSFDLQGCQQNTEAFTYDTGLYLEGLSVFANTTHNLTLIGL